jgi:cobalt-zinc-cadmium efflux system protein
MSIEGSFQHVLTDLFDFVGTAVAAAVIIATASIASLLVALDAQVLLRTAARVGARLPRGLPRELDPEAIGRTMAAVEGVAEVHDLHVRESPLASRRRPRTCSSVATATVTRRELEAVLGERYALEHTTLQVNHAGVDLLALELSPKLRRV